MWKLDRRALKLTFIWSALFILCSCILRILFCKSGMLVLAYHITLVPVYLLLSFSIIYFLKVFKKFIVNHNGFTTLVFVLIIGVISFSLRDFKGIFTQDTLSDTNSSFYSRMISSGCREMFFFISLVLSSLIMGRRLISISPFGKE